MMLKRAFRSYFVVPLVAIFLTLSVGGAASAACLSKGEMRALINSGAVVRLAAVRNKIRGEIVNVRLCERGGTLFYRVTVLKGNGNVIRVRFNARSGARMGRN
ncbi:MAG: hypothetical protein C0606_00560 [Hyphomicrobiales bacterium]|mgnify:CR=1 FL=1|nr:MAG: hypothetical protein C0606_00560 [Hyphomicrobiales bacterium]